MGVIFPVVPVLVIFGFEIIDVVVFEIKNQNYYFVAFFKQYLFQSPLIDLDGFQQHYNQEVCS